MSDFVSVERIKSLKSGVEAKTGKAYSDLTGAVQDLIDTRPAGELTITENGTHDVRAYESVVVDVAVSSEVETCTIIFESRYGYNDDYVSMIYQTYENGNIVTKTLSSKTYAWLTATTFDNVVCGSIFCVSTQYSPNMIHIDNCYNYCLKKMTDNHFVAPRGQGAIARIIYEASD